MGHENEKCPAIAVSKLADTHRRDNDACSAVTAKHCQTWKITSLHILKFRTGLWKPLWVSVIH